MDASFRVQQEEETVTFFPVSDGLDLSLFVNRELPPSNHSTQLAATSSLRQG
jgi:hypothetical protein